MNRSPVRRSCRAGLSFDRLERREVMSTVSTPGTVLVLVDKSAYPLHIGDAATIETDIVNTSNSGVVPSGTLSFTAKQNGTVKNIPGAIPFSGSNPVFNVPNLPVGTYDILVTYNSPTGVPIASSDITVTVTPTTQLTLINKTVLPLHQGDIPIFETHIVNTPSDGTVPSGTISFTVTQTGTLFGIPNEIPFSGDKPTFGVPQLRVGTDDILVTYKSVNGVTLATAHTTVDVLPTPVAPAPTTTTLNVISAPVAFGSFPTATLTATVTANDPASGTPTGSVDFIWDGDPRASGIARPAISSVLATVPLVNGQASFSINPHIGVEHIYAFYSPNANYRFSGSAKSTIVLGSPTEQYINKVYYAALGRAVDSPGLRFWDQAFANKQVTQASFADAILGSQEARTYAINTLYHRTLDRLPTPAELKSGLALGSHFDQVQAHVLGSKEFYADQNGSTTSYANDLFYAITNQLPAPASFTQYVTTSLQAHVSLRKIADNAIHSSEVQTAEVQSLYRQLLGRNVDPHGLAVSLKILARGNSLGSVRAAILSSPEYYHYVTQIK